MPDFPDEVDGVLGSLRLPPLCPPCQRLMGSRLAQGAVGGTPPPFLREASLNSRRQGTLSDGGGGHRGFYPTLCPTPFRLSPQH